MNRRNFLQGTLTAIAAAVLPVNVLSQATAKKAKMKAYLAVGITDQDQPIVEFANETGEPLTVCLRSIGFVKSSNGLIIQVTGVGGQATDSYEKWTVMPGGSVARSFRGHPNA